MNEHKQAAFAHNHTKAAASAGAGMIELQLHSNDRRLACYSATVAAESAGVSLLEESSYGCAPLRHLTYILLSH